MIFIFPWVSFRKIVYSYLLNMIHIFNVYEGQNPYYLCLIILSLRCIFLSYLIKTTMERNALGFCCVFICGECNVCNDCHMESCTYLNHQLNSFIEMEKKGFSAFLGLFVSPHLFCTPDYWVIRMLKCPLMYFYLYVMTKRNQELELRTWQ